MITLSGREGNISIACVRTRQRSWTLLNWVPPSMSDDGTMMTVCGGYPHAIKDRLRDILHRHGSPRKEWQ